MEQNKKIYQKNHRDQLIDSVKGVGILVELIIIFFMIKIIDRFVPWVLTPGMKSAKN